MGTALKPDPHRRRRPTTVRKASVGPPRPVRAPRPTPWEQQRAKLQATITKAPIAGIDSEEVATHFVCMPARYWLRTDKTALRWHLGTIHAFLAGLADPASSGTTPMVRWRQFPTRHFTEIAVCTWDRLGLLAKVAGALADTSLNILRAEIYTRTDNLVLDVFQVCGPDHNHIADELLLRHVSHLLDAALRAPVEHAGAPPPPRGGSHPRTDNLAAPQRPAPSRTASAPTPVVSFDNDRSRDCTILGIETGDRVGLLHSIFKVLADCEVNVAQAVITTDQDQAGDLFYLTDSGGHKIRDNARLHQIRQQLLAVL